MDSHRLLPLKTLSGVIILFSIFLFACKQKRNLIKVDPAFSKYIEAYTSGVVSKKNTVRIQLTSDVSTTHALNENIKEALFDFTPSVNGKAYWIDERTIEFKPEKDLQPDELYEVQFKLNKVRKVPDNYKTFAFNIQTIKPSFSVEENGLRASETTRDQMSLS